jgi:hypothetical protein
MYQAASSLDGLKPPNLNRRVKALNGLELLDLTRYHPVSFGLGFFITELPTPAAYSA